MKNGWVLVVLAVILCGLLASCAPADTPETDKAATAAPAEGAGLPNPASQYCLEQGYQYENRTAADGSQTGFCIFPDGSECDEWALYRGECGPEAASE